MATFIFSELLKKAIQLGITKNVEAAKQWFRAQASQMANVNANELLRSDPSRFLRTNRINQNTYGKMVMFFYDPKWKKKLPYYDRFPLIFPVEEAKGGFYGINMHYLSPWQRARLFDALVETLSRGKDDKQRLMLS